jgi:hypothetical protein
MTSNILIKPATHGDFAALRDIELAAFETLSTLRLKLRTQQR